LRLVAAEPERRGAAVISQRTLNLGDIEPVAVGQDRLGRPTSLDQASQNLSARSFQDSMSFSEVTGWPAIAVGRIPLEAQRAARFKQHFFESPCRAPPPFDFAIQVQLPSNVPKYLVAGGLRSTSERFPSSAVHAA
jgi:hypothetical protein